jgi:hypothetical protein
MEQAEGKCARVLVFVHSDKTNWSYAYRMACPALLVVSSAVLLLLLSVKTTDSAASPSSLLAPQTHTTASRQRHRLKDT